MEEVAVFPARHGEDGHVCDRDQYPRAGDPTFPGPHLTKVIPACGSCGTEWRAMCACGYLGGLMPSRQSAVVSAWLHRRKVDRAPRAVSDE